MLPPLRPLTITYLGDSTNVLHDMLVTLPRLGHKIRVGAPAKDAYACPPEVWSVVQKLGCDKNIFWTSDPKKALQGADVVVTDTWISMGQEAEKAQRLQDFKGFQVTEALAREGGANPDWKFLHCLPRKPDEVDDEVGYSFPQCPWSLYSNVPFSRSFTALGRLCSPRLRTGSGPSWHCSSAFFLLYLLEPLY